jgi:hypothetical protein
LIFIVFCAATRLGRGAAKRVTFSKSEATKSKKQGTPKSQPTPKTKATTESKAKRRRSELDICDDEGFNDFVEDSDEECETAKEQARIPKPKFKDPKVSTGRLATQRIKASKAELDIADVEMINLDIQALSEDGGPAICCWRKLACVTMSQWSSKAEPMYPLLKMKFRWRSTSGE